MNTINNNNDPGVGDSFGVGDTFGVVYKKTIGHYYVNNNGSVILCGLSNRLRKDIRVSKPGAGSDGKAKKTIKTIDNVDPVAIGDRVHYIDAHDGTGLIVEVLPRRNRLARQTAVPMPSARPFEQVIVSNIDQVVPVFSAAEPAPKWHLLDRYLVSAESLDLPSLIVITKIDLVQGDAGQVDEEIREVVSEYRRIGYRVIMVSSITGEGLNEVCEALKGKVSVFLGKSGVGKTSLLNAIQPELGLRVNEISQSTGKGKHTTTHLEMFSLNIGGAIVDTPGINEFGLWDVDEEDMAMYFPEMRSYLGTCKFGLGCQHDEEPGCAIRKAVSDGKISPHRYSSYMRLRGDA